MKYMGRMQCPRGSKKDCMRVNKVCLARHIEEDEENSAEETTQAAKRYSMRNPSSRSAPTAKKRRKQKKGEIFPNLGRRILQPILENEMVMHPGKSIQSILGTEGNEIPILIHDGSEEEKNLQNEGVKEAYQEEQTAQGEVTIEPTPPCIMAQTPLAPHSPVSPNTSPIMTRRNKAMLARERRGKKAIDTMVGSLNDRNSDTIERISETEIDDDSPTEETRIGIHLEDSDDNEDGKMNDFVTPKTTPIKGNANSDSTALQISFPVGFFEKIKIPGDGFCMVQSVLKTLKIKASKREILDKMKIELYNHIDE